MVVELTDGFRIEVPLCEYPALNVSEAARGPWRPGYRLGHPKGMESTNSQSGTVLSYRAEISTRLSDRP
jgi:hypothetical protein